MAFGSSTADGAVYPSGAHADPGAALDSPRGLLMVVTDPGAPPAAAHRALIGHIIRVYEEIPPDVDRLVALRATLDKVTRLIKAEPRGRSAAGRAPDSAPADVPSSAPFIAATVVRDQWYAISAGALRGYHIQANGRIDLIRMEPTAQRKLDPDDSILLCTPSVSDKLDEYEIALSLYSRNPQSAVQRLLMLARRKGAQGTLAAVAFGTNRSLLDHLFGRASQSGAPNDA